MEIDLQKVRKKNYIRKQSILILKILTHFKKGKKLHTTQWRKIYEVIKEDHFT